MLPSGGPQFSEFACSNTERGKLDAYGMFIDKYCYLLIPDFKNHCVHYVSREGGLIQILLTRDKHGVEYPYGIGVDNEEGMYGLVFHGNDLWYVGIYRRNIL